MPVPREESGETYSGWRGLISFVLRGVFSGLRRLGAGFGVSKSLETRIRFIIINRSLEKLTDVGQVSTVCEAWHGQFLGTLGVHRAELRW